MTDVPDIPLGNDETDHENDGVSMWDTAPPADNDTDPSADGDADPTTDDDGEPEPVEVLVQLAEEGRIEPWDIDIVAVTDTFLAELEQRDLRTSGRALFYASVLLRMKSEELLSDDEDEADDEPEPWETAFRDGPGGGGFGDGGESDEEFDPVDALEAEMDRRLERKSTRGSPETLDELVRELREAERDSWWKESREYDTTGGSDDATPAGTQTLQYRGGSDPRPETEPGADDVTETTHEEDIESVIETVRAALTRQYDQGRPEVLFREVRTAGGSPVQTYLALLFLAHRGDVRLQQDDLFGDLWIRDPAAPTVGDEAVAD
jgi:segregation and condensation protein A